MDKKNFVVDYGSKKYVFSRFVEALAFMQDLRKVDSVNREIKQYESKVNSKYDLEKGELVMNQNEVNNEALIMPEASNDAAKTKWLTIPWSIVGKEFETKDKNGKPHKYVFINIPQDENSKVSFSLLSAQVLQHPFIKEFCNIPISEYGINLCRSEKVAVEPMAQNGDVKVGPTYKWVRDDEIDHKNQEEAVAFVSNCYKNLNNKETCFMLLPVENCKKIKSKEAKNKGGVNVILPDYLLERDGFNYEGANFIINKVYHLTNEKMEGIRAIQCSPKAVFRVYGKDDKRYIDIKAVKLYEYNKEDYKAYVNGKGNEETAIGKAFEESSKEEPHSSLKEDAAKVVQDIEKTNDVKESNAKEEKASEGSERE